MIAPAYLPGEANLGADALTLTEEPNPGPSGGEESAQTPRRTRGGSVCIQPVSSGGEILHARQEGQESRRDKCHRGRVGL